jgi:hypothetical protein
MNQKLYNQQDDLVDLSIMTKEQITLELVAYDFTDERLQQSERETEKLINEFLAGKNISNPLKKL